MAKTNSVKLPREITKEFIDEYLNRELYRPKTTWTAPILVFIAMLILPFIVAHALIYLLACPKWLYAVCYFSIDILLIRLLLITLIKCYQHYASEKLRRYCLCVPSCSEYALAVLKKYLLVVAVYKIIYRLKVTCDGEIKVDLP